MTSQTVTSSLADYIRSKPAKIRQAWVDSLPPARQRALLHDWTFWGRPSQLIPGTSGAAIQQQEWRFWLALAGRGWGKTLTGAQTVRQWATNPKERILLVAPTAADVRDVMIEGPSGLMSCYPADSRPIYLPTRHLIVFPSGAIGITRSADEPERLRGPQFTKFWADELCAWKYIEEAWAQIQFGFRLPGDSLKGVITTTPKPFKTLKWLAAHKKTVVTHGSSYENRTNLSPDYFADVIAPYEGTRLGRQEINAEILEDVPGALWTQALIDRYRVTTYPSPFVRVVIPIDPAVSAGENSSETGIGVVGLMNDGHAYVLEDCSGRYQPNEWAVIAINLLRKWRADLIVGEVNNGGDLVESNLRSVNPNIPYRQVRASRGKLRRAEPVANLYEQGRVHHWIDPDNPTHLQQLETQMCSYVAGTDQDSPDRMDWLVWGITELLIDLDQTPTTQAIGQRVQISRY